MPNSYFQFKQVTINQDKSTLKVCTDACIFGAWAARAIQNSKLEIQNCLDIGTGTGLLALMLAQKNENILIEAVEIDRSSAEQAAENFEASPWAGRLNVQHISIQQFVNSPTHKFDFIISNPPFFENDLKSDLAHKNISKHDESLKLDELLDCINELLTEKGKFAILLPYHRTGYFISLCEEKELYIEEKLFIKQTPQHDHFRTIILGSREASSHAKESSLTIRKEEGIYSDEFVELLKDYYLYL